MTDLTWLIGLKLSTFYRGRCLILHCYSWSFCRTDSLYKQSFFRWDQSSGNLYWILGSSCPSILILWRKNAYLIKLETPSHIPTVYSQIPKLLLSQLHPPSYKHNQIISKLMQSVNIGLMSIPIWHGPDCTCNFRFRWLGHPGKCTPTHRPQMDSYQTNIHKYHYRPRSFNEVGR